MAVGTRVQPLTAANSACFTLPLVVGAGWRSYPRLPARRNRRCRLEWARPVNTGGRLGWARQVELANGGGQGGACALGAKFKSQRGPEISAKRPCGRRYPAVVDRACDRTLRAQMTVPSLSLPSRLWLSWSCFFRVLFDGHFAARVAALREREASEALPAPSENAPLATPAAEAPSASPESGALQLLSLLQREGRFVDFVEQEVTAFSDADVGAAARVVHEGCRRALHAHARIASVRGEAEGAALTLERANSDVKLVGNVAGSAPYRGVLRHRGWRVEELKLPTLIGAHDPKLVAPAELELP